MYMELIEACATASVSVIENYRKYDKKNEERLMAYAKAMRIGRQVERIGLDR